MQDTETGQRGFLITADENYLKLYEAGVEAAPIKLANCGN